MRYFYYFCRHSLVYQATFLFFITFQPLIMENILQNIELIQQRIAKACAKAGRKPEEVKLLLATKTVTPERIKIALEAGYTLIAENKVQELKEKI